MTISRRHLLLGSSSALCLAACGGGGSSEPENTNSDGGSGARPILWTEASRGRIGRSLADVCVGADVLVARGSNGLGANADLYKALSYSTDQGRTWVAVNQDTLNDAADITGLAYGNGRFVAVTSFGDVLTSTDGKVWSHTVDASSIDSRHPDNMWRVAYGNGVFLAIGTRNFTSSTWSSVDGIVWTDARPVAYPGFLEGWSHLVHENGKFYRAQGAMSGSADAGLSWISVRAPYSRCEGIAFGNGTYVLVGDLGKISTADSDGGPWTERHDIDVTDDVRFVGFVHDVFIVTEGHHIHTSRDGKTWTSTEAGRPGDSFSKVVFDGTHFIAIGPYGLTMIGAPG